MRLRDKVLILEGKHAGREGFIVAFDQVFGYNVQLDDFSETVHFRWPYPDVEPLQVRSLEPSIVRAEHKPEPVDETVGPLDEYRGQ